ncbi:carbohydrate ABC transporter permease [Propionimicrobium sp. PCR01-08-3]|uniref:carbohydrate ABC transporter permease n=1 Tax=Propionimicrobium sp. PCR01-08-3 TaxID=3052086 RepID=UPI00255CF7A3|nr:carbohydrate ABC transporter permease [Propionimicrobium sp. PCR01-08-3]WIY83364.1 carbohydrate ABC transporter permease [Propionimicrobium sp. PCR01-08-3]
MRKAKDRNWFGGILGWSWLLVVLIPIYYILVTSFKSSSTYLSGNPLALPVPPDGEQYSKVVDEGFVSYFTNSLIVTVGTVVPLLLIALMASYAIVRGRGRAMSTTKKLFLLGLSIPIQATIIPVYLIIIRLHLYDSLTALILPGIAFALPLTILILTNFMRDIPKELFESMSMDGCTEWQMLWRLALPMSRPSLVTVGIYQALHQWNGFLFPLVLTQSPERRVLPLFLWNFQGEFATDIPAVLAAVVLSSLPIIILYAFGRKQLVAGMTAGIGK